MVMFKRLSGCVPPALRRELVELYNRAFDRYATKSYSQEGEDMILQRLFAEKAEGFYVDVGAHHPQRFSNTYLFYKRGWRGINIEPNPGVIKTFCSLRHRDINVQAGVAESEGVFAYHAFDEPALNTFDDALAASREATTRYRKVATIPVPARRLEDILREHLPDGTAIDFLSIDVEGMDLAVLRSNDWGRYRPACVLVESLETALEGAVQGPIAIYMKRQGYGLFAKTVNTLFFLRGQTEPERGC